MGKKMTLGIILIIIVIFSACTQKYNPKEDFAFVIGHDGIVIRHYTGTRADVRIPPRIQNLPVAVIGDMAFHDNRLNSVIIPNSVTQIGVSAFANNQLINVTIPNSVTHIGKNAFGGNRLTSVIIPDNVTHIGDYAFATNRLTSVTIPDGVTHIGDDAFSDNHLSSVTIPNSVIQIGKGAFFNNQLASVTIPNSVTHIEESAFFINQLNSVTIPNSVIHIGDFAFSDNLLASVSIPNSITHIGNFAFLKNQLTSVTIPNSVTHIGEDTFADNQLISVIIPDNITLGAGAFRLNKLTNVSIGSNVRLDEEYYVFDIEFQDFYVNNRSRAGAYNYSNGRWSFSTNSEGSQSSTIVSGSVSGNRLANTTWETIVDGTRQTIAFGENGFRWTGEPWDTGFGMMSGRNEVGTYRIQGEMVYLEVPGFTYTGILLGNTLSISGFMAGWEFRRIN